MTIKPWFPVLFYTDADLRTTSLLSELVDIYLNEGGVFTPQMYLLEEFKHIRYKKFKIPSSLRELESAIKNRDNRQFSFLSTSPFQIEFKILIRPYDGVNKYGRRADPNAIVFDVDQDLFKGENSEQFLYRFLSLLERIYLKAGPFFGWFEDRLDYARKTQESRELFARNKHREEIFQVHWGNFLGPPLVELYGGRDHLLQAPCYQSRELGDGGFLLLLTPMPYSAGTPFEPFRAKELSVWLGLRG